MSALTWAGLPVAVRLVEPRYQVIVDSLGIGEVSEVGVAYWRWKHYETGDSGSGQSRRAACMALLARHTRLIDEFSEAAGEEAGR